MTRLDMRLAPVNVISESADFSVARKAQQTDCCSLNLLLFSVGGVHFGIDAGQVCGIEAYTGGKSDDLHWFHEELGYGGTTARYLAPMVITIRMPDAESYRVIIDSMEDISEFSQNDIRLFPALLEPFAIRKGLWGILPRQEMMVLLVDFQLLLKQKRSEIN